jgi:hypothetical protein
MAEVRRISGRLQAVDVDIALQSEGREGKCSLVLNPLPAARGETEIELCRLLPKGREIGERR